MTMISGFSPENLSDLNGNESRGCKATQPLVELKNCRKGNRSVQREQVCTAPVVVVVLKSCTEVVEPPVAEWPARMGIGKLVRGSGE
jgi:hypothetical protein